MKPARGIHPIRLPRGAVRRIEDGEGRRITTLAGAVWITQAGDHRDVVLACGQPFVLDRPGLAALYALRPAAVVVGPAEPAAARRRFTTHSRKEASFMVTPQQVEAGQAAYSPMVLRFYDLYVHGLSNPLLWRCPTRELRRLYDRNVSRRHLDVGVGTGYFLDKARWPYPDPEITLVDLNPNSLAAAARRIRRYEPRTVRANILEPLPALPRFTSAGLCYLLHCVPGAIPQKAVAFDHVRELLAPGGRVFGATIVQGTVHRSRAAQAMMNLYNGKGIFANAEDTAEDLEAALRARFSDVRVELKGVVALFEAAAD